MKTTRTIIITGILALTTIAGSAQSITVKSVSLQPSDHSAIEQPVVDNNGDTCALVKIKTDRLTGVEFPNKNQYARATYIDGTYWVYMPASIGRKLDFSHKDYLPTQIDMAEYGYKRLRGGKTYLVTVVAPLKSELKSKVILNVEPKEAIVKFNTEAQSYQSSGTYTIEVAPGNYSYQVELDNYQPITDWTSVGKEETKTLTVRLKPIMHKVMVKGNVGNARVIVDNIDYGKAGNMELPQGNHNIRIVADGYNDYSTSMSISSATGTVSFNLERNALVDHVHATPVTIYSSGSKVYKNNKEIKEWNYHNKTVHLMPGKYSISDNMNKIKKIVVGTEPMSVLLE